MNSSNLTPIRVLLVEDSEYDAELIIKELKASWDVFYERVCTPEEMTQKLYAHDWDIILADYQMPRFSGPAALELLKKTGLDIPLIIVSGTVGEEIAVDALRAGAQDFIVKGHFIRLIPAVKRELSERVARQELRQVERQFRQSEERYRTLIEGLTQFAILIIDATGYIQTWNEGAQKILGYPPEEAIGMHCSFLYCPEDRDRSIHDQSLAIAVKMGQYHEEGWRLKKHGERFWAEITITPMFDDKAQLIGYSKIAIDRTQEREAQKALEESKDQAELANQKKSQFLANMSHELRTPLNSIIGYSEMILNNMVKSSEDLERYARNISVSGRHLLDIVNDMLDVSKIEAGKLEIHAQPVDLQKLVQELHDVLVMLANQKEIKIFWDVAPEVKTVEADPQRLRQILFNLMSNAIKFNRPGGKVMLNLCRSQDERWFQGEVTDTGIGIPRDKIDQLFSDFYQVDSSSSKSYDGTGLGLALTKRLLAVQGGDISVDSEEGKGSTFLFRLPIRRANPESA